MPPNESEDWHLSSQKYFCFLVFSSFVTFEVSFRFFNANSITRPDSENALAEIGADAKLKPQQGSLASVARQHKTPVTGASAEIVAFACLIG